MSSDAPKAEAPRGPAEELARLAEELRYQRDLVTTITDNAATGLFMMDRDGHPIFMNAAACAMTGYAGLHEIRGRPLHYAVHFKKPDGSPYPMEECPIDRANAEIRPLKDQLEVWCRKDGTLFPVRYNVAPLERNGERLGAVIEVRDITDEVRHEEERARLLRQAEEAHEKLHTLFREAPAAIAMVDGPRHVFSFVNRRYEELVGHSAAQLLGRPAGDALPSLVEQGFIELLDRVRKSGAPFEAQGAPVVMPHAGGTRVTYHNFTYQPVRGPSGEVESILGVAIDVTQQVEAQRGTKALAEQLEMRVEERTRQLTSANHELAQINDALESFSYVISHDLKEPVRGIEAYLMAAQEAESEAERRDLIQRALETNRRQHKLIQGLLAYSRASFSPLDLQPVDLTALITHGCRAYYEQVLRDRGVVLQVDLLPTVRGNEVLLCQLFGNLVLNAARYGPTGELVHVHAPARAQDDPMVEVLIDDAGPGFPPTIKDALRRLDRSRPASIKGGFGLAISHRAAERLGGRIELEDRPGGGARVRVLLPRA